MDAVRYMNWEWKFQVGNAQEVDRSLASRRTKMLSKPTRVRAQGSQNSEGSVLAIDVGTGGTKAALISSSGRLISSAFASHQPPAPSPMGWQASMEQDQEGWWLAAKMAIKDCLSNNSSRNFGIWLPDAIALTGQMQDVILLPKIAELAGGSSSLVSTTGQLQGGTSLLAKLRWLDKHDMSAAAECKNILFGGHDYITWKLTGALVTDATTASTTGLTDLSFQYAESLIKTVNLGHWLEMLPHIAPVDIPCGEVSEAAAIELGFPLLKAIPVLHCCGDAGACSLGAGAGIPGSMYGYLGTSGWVAGSFLRSPENVMRSVPGVFTLAHPDSTLVFRTGSIMTAGGNLAWAASNLVYTSRRDILLMKEVDKLARLAQTGCGGLLYLPFLTGERCPFEDPIARAAFIGISSDTTLPEMFRSDVGVKGAALLAGKWLGWHSTFSPGGDWLKVQQTYYPSHEDSLAFDSLFSTYKEAYRSLKNIFEKLSHYRK